MFEQFHGATPLRPTQSRIVPTIIVCSSVGYWPGTGGHRVVGGGHFGVGQYGSGCCGDGSYCDPCGLVGCPVHDRGVGRASGSDPVAGEPHRFGERVGGCGYR